MKKGIVENVSFKAFKKKYARKLKKGEIIYITDKEVNDYNRKHTSSVFNGKEYKFSLLDKKRTYYHIGNRYYLIPRKLNKKNVTLFSVLGALVISGGVTAGYFIANKKNLVETNLDPNISAEVKKKTEISVDQPAEVGQEYTASINLKKSEVSKQEVFIPVTLNKVTTGGVELQERHKTSTQTRAVNTVNDAEPENYYTYTLNDERSSGTIYIKKVLGPVVLSFDLSHTFAVQIESEPTTKSYWIEEAFSLDGLNVQKKQSKDAEWEDLDLRECKMTYQEGYVFKKTDIGNQKVDVVYDNCATSFNITVKNNVTERLEIAQQPNKATYLVGETLNKEGLIVNAINTRGDVINVTDIATYSMGVDDIFEETDIDNGKDIVITYDGVSTTLHINDIRMPLVLNIKKTPKTVYSLGESLDLSGLVLATSRNTDGLFSEELNRKNCKITCDGNEIAGDIKFDQEGVIKKIGITFKSLPTKYINCAVPVVCNDQQDFHTKVHTGNYNAFMLKEQDNPYYLLAGGAPVGTSNLDVMFVGENQNVKFDSYSGNEPGACELSEYANYCLANYNVTFDNLTFVSLDPVNSNKVVNYAGFVNYNSAIYNKIKFDKCTYSLWGNSVNDYSTVESRSLLSAFYNCEFNYDTESISKPEDYLMWTYSGTFEFYDTLFNAYSRVFNFYRQAGNPNVPYNVTFDNCEFKTAIKRSQWIEEDLAYRKVYEDPNATAEAAKGVLGIKDEFPVLINCNNCEFNDTLKSEDDSGKGYELVTTKKNGNYTTSDESLSKVYINGVSQTWSTPLTPNI